MKKSNCLKKGRILILILILTLFSNIILADCAEDQYIPLSYPDDYKGNPRTTSDPINTGLIWIPKEACGKEVDLLITLHGWRDLNKPGDSIYLTPPIKTFSADYPGQQTTQKEFDKIVRQYIDSGKSRPLIIAAPMHDRGPHETVFTQDAYNINTHIQKINQKLAEKSITAQIKTVSIMGHSNANCGGSLRRSAKELINYPLYLVGAADGTCESDYLKDFLPFVQENKNAILFHMHQGIYDGDKSSADSIKSLGGSQDTQVIQSEYTNTWKSNDNKFYTYQVKMQGHSHTDIPMVLLKEVLPRFFSGSGAGAITKGQASVSAAGKVTAGTTLQKVPKDVPGCLNPTRCREIDQAWDQKVSSLIGVGINQVWDHQTNSWKKYDDLYFELKAIATNSLSGTALSTTGTTIASLPPSSGTGLCFNQAVSSSKEEANSKLTTITFQNKKISINKIIAPLLKKIDQQITELNINYPITTIGSFNWRCICSPEIKYPDPEDCHTRTSCIDTKGRMQISKHSYGLALDINPQENPFCTEGEDHKMYRGGKECPLHENGKYYDLPEGIIAIFKANDFRWGGEFNGAKDYMHFDWQGNVGDFNNDGQIEQCPQGINPSSSSSSSSSTMTFIPAQKIEEIKTNQQNIKAYTYQSNCPKAGKQTIIYNTEKEPTIAYFMIHGNDDPSPENYCNGIYKFCTRASENKYIAFIGLRVERGKQKEIDFKCLYQESQKAFSALNIPWPSSNILAGFSRGGEGLKHIYTANLQPENIIKTIFFDACYGNQCQTVAGKPSSERGELYMYASKQTTTQTGLKQALKTNNELLHGVIAQNNNHGEIPTICFNNPFNENDLCTGKGLNQIS